MMTHETRRVAMGRVSYACIYVILCLKPHRFRTTYRYRLNVKMSNPPHPHCRRVYQLKNYNSLTSLNHRMRMGQCGHVRRKHMSITLPAFVQLMRYTLNWYVLLKVNYWKCLFLIRCSHNFIVTRTAEEKLLRVVKALSMRTRTQRVWSNWRWLEDLRVLLFTLVTDRIINFFFIFLK